MQWGPFGPWKMVSIRFIVSVIASLMVLHGSAGWAQSERNAAPRGAHYAGTGVQSLANSRYDDRIADQSGSPGVRSLAGTNPAPMIRARAGAFRLRDDLLPEIVGNDAHLIVQLDGPLTEVWRSRLAALGVVLHGYLPSHAWGATVAKARLADVRNLPFVHAVGRFYPVDKLPAQVLERDFHSRSFNMDGTLTVDVYFYPDVSYARAVASLAGVDGRVEQSDFSEGRRLTATVVGEQILAMLALDEVQWVEDREPPKLSTNFDAAALARVPPLWASPLELAGRGVVMGIWDAGAVDYDHVDFGDRVAIVEDAAVSSHATHVAGTMVGSGYGNSSARGVASRARLLSHDYFGDVVGEQRTAVVDNGMAISNHSWTYASGWQYNRYGDGRWVWYGGSSAHEENFGAYTALTAIWDRLIYDHGLIVVKSAGNDRNDHGAGSDPHYHIGDESTLHTDWHRPDGDYDSVGQTASAKNVITVGAVDDAAGMTAYSGWGPTDDGRVKPDIVANGSSVYSTYPNNRYAFLGGTSQATPVVSGAVGLLVEHYRRSRGIDPGADVIKALVAHSARDLGQPGPDYVYGWGMLDAAAAAGIVEGDQGRVDVRAVASGEHYAYARDVEAGTDRLKVTIAWTDLPALPMAASALVNDLDLALVAPDGRVYHPFSLAGRVDPRAAATRHGPNRVDNIEQVIVESPMAGRWTVSVIGHSVHGRQVFALVSDETADGVSHTSASISINDGASQVHRRDVLITLAGSSNEGITGYYLAEQPLAPADADFVAVATTAEYETQVPFSLSADDGVKTVYGWVRDAGGTISPAAFDTVNLVSQSAGGGGGGGVLGIITVVVLLVRYRGLI